MRPLSIALILLFQLFAGCAFAQVSGDKQIDSIVKKFEYYGRKNSDAVLYAHFDKTIYTNGENVWFTAYLLNDDVAKRDVLSSVLVRDDDHSIVLRQKFVINKGIAFGNLLIPDSLASGNYSFLLYANNIVKGKPVITFIQPVTVKNTFSISFNASLALLDSAKLPGGQYKIMLTTSSGSGNPAGAFVKYYIGNKLHPLVSGTVKTDKAGEYVFNVPADGIALGTNTVDATITYKKEQRTVKLMLPVQKKPLSVRFYPEGGNLSESIESTVGWEVKTMSGLPLKVSGVLYRDGKVLDTISTDSYGMGSFRLAPNGNSYYHVRLLLNGYRDSVYRLPAAIPGMHVITMPNAIVNDTLTLTVKSVRPARVYLLVHNYRQAFYVTPIDIVKNVRKVKIILDSIPTGIAEVTLLDSLRRPCAERLFFAHYDRRLKLNITTGKDSYGQREKINVKLKLAGADEATYNGVVSIACVQANRVELKKAINIDSYYYLDREIGSIPEKEDHLGNDPSDRKFLENVLLIRGWRRYVWHDLVNASPGDTLQRPDPMNFTGILTHSGKPFKNAAMIGIMKDSSFRTVASEPGGHFLLNDENLFMINGKKAYLYVSGENPEYYEVNVHDPYLKPDSIAARGIRPIDYNNLLPDGQKLITDDLAGLEHAIHLKEVKIVANKDDFLSGATMHPLANECGDYVCLYNILNCPNHRNDSRNRPPVVGERYTYNGMPTIYTGCVVAGKEKKNTSIAGIYYSMEFYPADYSQVNPSQSEYVSTVYWKHLAAVSSDKDLDISFYASDITGDFKIIVQGISDDGVIHAEKTIRIRKPQGSK